jgi:hypothetical protein
MPTVAPLDLQGHCIAAAWLANIPFFALADGVVHRLDGGQKWTEAHDGLLAAAVMRDGRRLLTGGEDGKVQTLSADGSTELLAEVICAFFRPLR